MDETINIQEVSNSVTENISTINDELNLIVTLTGLSITAVFFALYFTKLRSKQLLNYVPNVWTSLGILGTFIAIVVSLDSSGSSSLSDVDTLVKNIIPAFTTSIIGIIGAVVCSVAIKIIYAYEEKEEDEFYRRTVGNEKSPELVLNDIKVSLLQLIKVSQNQEANIKSFLNNYIHQLDAFYSRIYESNKEQVKILSDEYVHNVTQVLAETNEEINRRINTLLLSHSESVQAYLKTEKEKLDEVANDIKSFLNNVPESVDEMKIEMIEVLRKAIIEKYNQLLEGNDAFTNQLLERVCTFESRLAAATSQNCSDTLNTTQSEIQRIITLLESSLKSQSNSMERVSATLSADINNLVSAVNKSIGDYEAMVEQLNKLIPVLQEHIKHSEDSVSASEQNSEKLTEVLKTLDEIVKKNQQLRYELTQWRRVHKKVKINDKNGTKECPNCSAENPIDANFCRKCNYGFWDCETIASSLK